MKVSLNLLRQMTGLKLNDVDEVVGKINRQLGGVEEIVDLNDKYKDAVIVKVVSCEKHPDADKLSICQVDAGKNIPESIIHNLNSDNLVQVVCGAPNVRADMWAVWLPPESTVPSTYDDKEPFVLGARELRGAMSNGMLAAGDELAINNDHDGILEITENENIKPGDSFAEKFGLDDVILDIENKMFTHRPDCFGVVGVAREVAGIYGQEFKEEDWYKNLPDFAEISELELEVFNDCPEVVPRFMAVAMKDIEIKPSPLWLQTMLVRLGSKPINNVVDITNYVMLLTGQPMHAYDYDKLHGHKLGSRLARPSEKAKLLNDKTYELDETDIVIADGESVIGLGGIMGGGDSEVSDQTKNIVLECANFDMYAMRKTSMKYGLFTDAVTRFNKGQSPLQNPYVLAFAMNMVSDLASGQQASIVHDVVDRDKVNVEMSDIWNDKEVLVKVDFINSRLGSDLKKDEIKTLLSNVGFGFDDNSDDEFKALSPYWRTDIEIPEDIVEEVGRLYGYDKLPRELPKRSMTPPAKNQTMIASDKIRNSLVKSGANEVLTYSFANEKTIKKADQDVSQAFKISNSLSPDLEYYRLTPLPSLLEKVHPNIKAGYDEFALFEIGKGHNKKYHGDDDNELPSEMEFLDIVYSSKNSKDGAPFYKIRRIVEQLAQDFGANIVLKPAPDGKDFPVMAPFELSRSALVYGKNDEFLGMIGELKSKVLKSFKLPDNTACATMDLQAFVKLIQNHQSNYTPLSKYPSVKQDICLEADEARAYSDVSTSLITAMNENVSEDMRIRVNPVDIYSGENTPGKKRFTFHVEVVSETRTLKASELTDLVNSTAQKLTESGLVRI